jgi:hypothetical protein
VRLSVQALAASCAVGALTACAGGHGSQSVAPRALGVGHAPAAHRVQSIEPIRGRIPAGSTEYTYQIVVVHGTDNVDHMFAAPESVTVVPGGVRVVNGAGKVIDFAGGAIVSRGTGQHYVRAGQRLPANMSHATRGRTFLTTEYR